MKSLPFKIKRFEIFKLVQIAFLIGLIFNSCKSKEDSIKPIVQSITESVYASGSITSENQYKVYSTVSGIVDQVMVDENSDVEVGSPIISIVNDAQSMATENAKLASDFNALSTNEGKLEDAKSMIEIAEKKMKNDALMLDRQKKLWAEDIGSKAELEQRELAYQNSLTAFKSSKEKYKELKNLLNFQATQARTSYSISARNTNDFIVKSKVKGKVYQINFDKGELVSPQSPIAIIGDDKKYILEMQIDEYDIVKIKLGMKVLVNLNSYKDSVFHAVVTKINPIMNIQSKTFTIESEFIQPPSVLFPNISFEANVLIQTKKDVLLIPRNYLINDSFVMTKSEKKILVKTGLKDYKMIEILSGIDKNEELILPK